MVIKLHRLLQATKISGTGSKHTNFPPQAARFLASGTAISPTLAPTSKIVPPEEVQALRKLTRSLSYSPFQNGPASVRLRGSSIKRLPSQSITGKANSPLLGASASVNKRPEARFIAAGRKQPGASQGKLDQLCGNRLRLALQMTTASRKFLLASKADFSLANQ